MTATNTDIEARATEYAGNWRKFDCFAWNRSWDGSLGEPDQWCIVYTSNRDSTLMDQSNAAIIEKIMAPFTEDDEPTAIAERHNHWACGYVDGYAIRVRLADGTITTAFKAWLDIQDRLSDYPILDEDHHSELECNATWENVQSQVKYVAGKYDLDYSEELASNVNEWLSNNKPNSLESRDDNGGFPDDDEIEEALTALGLLVDEE